MIKNLLCCIIALFFSTKAEAAPYAAIVIDARDGAVLHSRNAQASLHPASLVKMMTLFLAFDAVQKGEISLDSLVTVSAHASNEPPSVLGLEAGQQIQFRHLLRAVAVGSANDAATAIAESLAGSEDEFAALMNLTAASMGLERTSFRNAHGLTQNEQLSSAADMALLARHLIYDFPQYYNVFSRASTLVDLREVRNTNRRLLVDYDGADGVKTGYTRASGFNVVASAERGEIRIIAVLFGGTSSATRNERITELLDLGFSRAMQRQNIQNEELVRIFGRTRPVIRPYEISTIQIDLPLDPELTESWSAVVGSFESAYQATEAHLLIQLREIELPQNKTSTLVPHPMQPTFSINVAVDNRLQAYSICWRMSAVRIPCIVQNSNHTLQ